MLLFSKNLTAQNKVDSLKKFTPTQVRKMGDVIVKLHECDTLLSTTNQQLNVCQDKVQDQQEQLVFLKRENSDRDTIIANKNVQIQDFNKLLKKLDRRVKWTKFGWISTTAILGGLLIYSVAH